MTCRIYEPWEKKKKRKTPVAAGSQTPSLNAKAREMSYACHLVGEY
jgi:hypothetical protein